MALDGVYLEKIPQNEFQDIIRSIAVMNLKKYAGGTRANAKEIERVAHQDAYLLRQQIELSEPDILLTGGWGLTSNVLHDTICEDTTPWTKPNEQTNLWYYETGTVSKHHETLVVSLPHPKPQCKKLGGGAGKSFAHHRATLTKKHTKCRHTVKSAFHKPSRPK